MGYTTPNTYCLVGAFPTFDPADSKTYYFGEYVGLAPSETVSITRIYIPSQGVIRKAICHTIAFTADGTAENIVMSLRKNNTTDYALATVGTAATHRIFANYAMEVPVAQGDYVEVKFVTPAWVTNPTGFRGYITIYVESAGG